MMRPPELENFDEIEWLNCYFDGDNRTIQRDEIESVLFFVLFWNMFESLVCRKNANIPVIEERINQISRPDSFDPQDVQTYLQYFQNRYVTNGHVNALFQNLKFRPRDKEGLVIAVLTGKHTDPDSVLLALVLIVYRLRNNLFHGEKDVYRLNSQINNFKVANQFLATLLDAIKRQSKGAKKIP